MRGWLWRVVAVVVLGGIFIGFGATKSIQNSQQYARYMKQGISYVKQARYSQARNAFKNALTKNSSASKPSRYIAQLKDFQSGLKLFKNGKYVAARTAFKKAQDATGGSTVVASRAKDYVTRMTQIIKTQARFNKAYAAAKRLTNMYQYSASNKKLAIIINSSKAKQSYYKSIYKKARQLMKLNNTYLVHVGSTTTSTSRYEFSQFNGSTSQTKNGSQSSGGVGTSRQQTQRASHHIK